MDSNIKMTTIVVASQEQVSADLTPDFTGDSVVLDLRDGVYYELNEVATRIWKLVQEPVPVATILASLLAEYDVDADKCKADLLMLVQDMASRGLVELRYE